MPPLNLSSWTLLAAAGSAHRAAAPPCIGAVGFVARSQRFWPDLSLPPPSLTSPPDLLASSRHHLVPYRHHSTADLAAVGCALRARAVAALSLALSLCDRVRAGAAEIFLFFFTFFTQQASL